MTKKKKLEKEKARFYKKKKDFKEMIEREIKKVNDDKELTEDQKIKLKKLIKQEGMTKNDALKELNI